MSDNWQGVRVLVIGAARQGTALARYLVREGAHVILNDRRTPDQLAESIRQVEAGLEGPGTLRWELGGHPLRLLQEADLVCPSGGVPLELPLIEEAVRLGMPLTNDSEVFLQAAPCLVVGITGSAGKTTTTTLVGRMASAVPGCRAWVGGNIGNPLITDLEQMQTEDLVVMELSSFQLDVMHHSPQVGAVLNVTPNHLDRHGTMEAYWSAKANLLRYQSPQDVVVLGRDDPGAWAMAELARCRLVTFGRSEPPAGFDGAFERDGRVVVRRAGRETDVVERSSILLRGEHNLLNVVAACAIAAAAGWPVEAMRAGIDGFRGVPHRLEFVRRWRDTDWYNDSIATAPERAMAGLCAFQEPLVLLAGGRDKNLPWEEFAAMICDRVDHLVTFGETAEMIASQVRTSSAARRPHTVTVCRSFVEALEAAASVAEPGDVVLLSPGGTSFDEFVDFAERGERFKTWIMQQK